MKTKYTFWELLSNFKIEIPKIQRDYAHGRKDASITKLVGKFLNELKNSIINNQELNLDFVYGRVDDEILIPLDGQQRLTTLFLIHWYVAMKENKLNDTIKEVLSKFTYETRISSADFCKNLVEKNIDYNAINGSISETITDSQWYFLSWGLDPTVSAMLNMLDMIHNEFKAIETPLFEKLKKEANVSFNFLPLEQFKLTDELYIKMNARGKPLTAFENFKANFSNYLSLEDKSKLDNEWLDIFWDLEKNKNSEIETENVDDKFFNFFKNITLNFYAEDNEIDRAFIDGYNLFDTYDKVYGHKAYINQIIKVFDALTCYEDVNRVFTGFLSSTPSYWERLHFYSLSRFFIEFKQLNDGNKEIYNNWLRVTKNLINNTRIEGADNYKDAIRSIKALSENISNIYKYVSSSADAIKYFSKIQREEESLKAKLILEDEDWKNLFIEIETHPYFDGQIGFILKYAKNRDIYDKSLFIGHSSKLSKLFSSEFKEGHKFLFQRALLTKGNYLPQVGNSDNFTFCVFDEALRTKSDNWRKVFNDQEKTLILKDLLNDIENENICEELEKIIKHHNISDWRKLIIEDFENISYCQIRHIRRYSDDKIYLLSKQQMNGRHKELFSWELFKRKFEGKTFPPFTEKSWYWESTSWDEPCIVLESFYRRENRFAIDISYGSENKFLIKFYDWNGIEIPADINDILKDLKFKGNKISLAENELDRKIEEICHSLDGID